MAYNASPAQDDDKNMVSSNPVPPPGGESLGGDVASASTAGQAGQAQGNAVPVQNQQQTAQSSAATGVQTKPASSGGFTNLQSYMNQNKNAGQQLTNRIGTGVNRDVGTSVNKTNRALTSTEQAKQTAQTNLGAGQNYLQQMSAGSSYVPTSAEAADYLNPYLTANSPTAQQTAQAAQAAATPAPTPGTFSAESFVNDPAKLAQYNALRTGTLQQADQAALAQNLTGAQQQQGSTQQLVSNLANQLGSSQNQGNLLSQYINRNPQYSQSAQNLDTYFLQKDQPGLANVQNQVKGAQNTTLKDIAGKISGLQTGAGELSKTGQDLSNNLQNKSNENVQGLLTQLTGETDKVNAIRDAEQAYAKDQFNALKGNTGIDQRFADTLGLNQGQHIYSTVTNMDDPTGILNFSNQRAQTANDVANQQDVNQYAALAKLAGLNKDAYALKAPSTLDQAYSARTDDTGSLANRLAAIQNEINTTNSSGTYSNGGSNGGFNAAPVGSYTATGNLGNVGSILEKYGIGGTTGSQIQQNTSNAYGSTPQISSELMGAYGQSGPFSNQSGTNLAASNALQNAYQQLANYGYFNRLNIKGADQGVPVYNSGASLK